jgi:signal transduction histidine kinase
MNRRQAKKHTLSGWIAAIKQRPYFPLWLCLLLGVGFSLTASIVVARWEQSDREKNYNQKADSLNFFLQRQLGTSLHIARALGRFYRIHDRVTREKFHRFSERPLELNSYNKFGMVGLGWAPKIPASEKNQYEANQHLQIWFNNDSPLSNQMYFPTTYIEPYSKLKSFLGYDHYSHKQRRAAIKKARDLGMPTATKSIDLREIKGSGFYIYFPLYEKGKPAHEVVQRRQAFTGVSFLVVQIRQPIQQALKNSNFDHLNISLYTMSMDRLNSALAKGLDMPQQRFAIAYDSNREDYIYNAKQTNLHQPPTTANQSHLCPYSENWKACIQTLHVAGQEWSLLVLPGEQLTGFSGRAGATLAIGLLATSTLSSYLFMSIRKTIETKNMYAELQSAHQAAIESRSQLQERTQELESTLSELQRTQAQLVQTEKMSSLGQLVAGVAHEINNPVGFISGNIEHIRFYAKDLTDLLQLYEQYYEDPPEEIRNLRAEIELDFVLPDLYKTLDSMKLGAERIQNIVTAMRTFSRLHEAEVKPVDIHEGIDSTVMLLQSRLKATNQTPSIEIVRQYGDLPLVECHAGEINQVFMHTIDNAIDALKESNTDTPTISIQTQFMDDRTIAICIADNGKGIPTEEQSRLFDPFYTTKPVGQGTGLGLFVSYRIITEFHQGKMYFSSQPEQGTEFWIELPISFSNGKRNK